MSSLGGPKTSRRTVLASVLNRRKKQSDKNRNACRNNKQFDKGETHSVLHSIYSVLHNYFSLVINLGCHSCHPTENAEQPGKNYH